MENPNNLSLLESLPRDLLGEILSRVASSSRQSIRNCLTVSRRISSAVQDDRVFKRLTCDHKRWTLWSRMKPTTILWKYVSEVEIRFHTTLKGSSSTLSRKAPQWDFFTLRSLPKVSMKWDLSLCHPYVVHRKPSRGYGVLTFPWVGDKQVSSWSLLERKQISTAIRHHPHEGWVHDQYQYARTGRKLSPQRPGHTLQTMLHLQTNVEILRTHQWTPHLGFLVCLVSFAISIKFLFSLSFSAFLCRSLSLIFQLLNLLW